MDCCGIVGMFFLTCGTKPRAASPNSSMHLGDQRVLLPCAAEMEIVAALLTAQFGDARVDAEQELVLLQVRRPPLSSIHTSACRPCPQDAPALWLSRVVGRPHGRELHARNYTLRLPPCFSLCLAQVDGVDVVVDHQAGKVDCTDPGLQVGADVASTSLGKYNPQPEI